jgi:4a-hydroxytetrahydrobiopterin dehydratase
MTVHIRPAQFHAADGIDDWRCLYHVASAHFRAGTLGEGIALAAAIERLADAEQQQYLSIDLRPTGLTVTLLRLDIPLAQRISAAAAELGIPADPSAVQLVIVTLDVLVGADVVPFWRALLGYVQIDDNYLADPLRRSPGLGLQQMDEPRPQRNRIHLDIAVPHEQAETRIAAALKAGGRLVSDEHAPKWWTLADPEGNEACIATWVGRD